MYVLDLYTIFLLSHSVLWYLLKTKTEKKLYLVSFIKYKNSLNLFRQILSTYKEILELFFKKKFNYDSVSSFLNFITL